MAVFDTGRVCIKKFGKEKGKKCVVVDAIDQSYVMISGKGVKRRRCNVNHLEATPETLSLKKGASDKDVEALLK